MKSSREVILSASAPSIHPGFSRYAGRLLIIGTLLVMSGGDGLTQQDGNSERTLSNGGKETVHSQSQAPTQTPVLPSKSSEKETALRPREGAPKITLSNVRTRIPGPNSLDPMEFVFDWTRTGEIPKGATFTIWIKSPYRRSPVTTNKRDLFIDETRGTFVLRDGSFNANFVGKDGPNLATLPLTLWVEMEELWRGWPTTQQVSNSISTNGGPAQLPREWTDEEKKRYDQFQKWQTPLPSPPAGYTVASSSTKLIPGMPVLEARTHEWLPAEVLDDRDDGKVLISSEDTNNQPVLNEREWIAVQDSTLLEARTNPEKFKPSIRILHGGMAPVPEEYVAIDPETKLYPGTCVEMQYGLEWRTHLISEILDAQNVRVFDPTLNREETDVQRSSLLLKPQTAELLKKPDAEKRLAARLERTRSGKPTHNLMGVWKEEITTLPTGAKRIPAGLDIPEGTKLMTRKTPTVWQDLEYLGENWDGRYCARTTGHVKFEGAIDPEMVLISTYELAKLTGQELPPGEPSESTPNNGENPKDPGKTEEKPDSAATPGGLSGQLTAVLPSMTLLPGVPVRAEDHFGQRKEATILKTLDSDHVEVIWDGWGSRRGEKIHRSKLLIDKSVVPLLDRPGYPERFVSGIERARESGRTTRYKEDDVGIRLPIPSGAVRVTDKTPLSVGAKLGINGKDRWQKDRWWDVTVLAVYWDDTVLVHIDGEWDNKDGEVRRNCLIISKGELKRQEEIAASRKSSSGSTESTIDETPDLLAVDEETQLVPGTPVYIQQDGNWKEATVIRTFSGNRVIVLQDELAGTNKIEEARREDLKFRPEVQEALKVPENEEKFASRAERIKQGDIGKKYPTAQYPVRDPLPRGAVRVTKTTPLVIGTRLGLYRHVRWVDVTVVDLNWDDTVRIHIDDEDSSEDGDIDRSCLIIAKTVLQELQAIKRNSKPESEK